MTRIVGAVCAIASVVNQPPSPPNHCFTTSAHHISVAKIATRFVRFPTGNVAKKLIIASSVISHTYHRASAIFFFAPSEAVAKKFLTFASSFRTLFFPISIPIKNKKYCFSGKCTNSQVNVKSFLFVVQEFLAIDF
jgi:hypothetical protein